MEVIWRMMDMATEKEQKWIKAKQAEGKGKLDLSKL